MTNLEKRKKESYYQEYIETFFEYIKIYIYFTFYLNLFKNLLFFLLFLQEKLLKFWQISENRITRTKKLQMENQH